MSDNVIAIIFIMFSIAVFGWIKEKTLVNPITIFNTVWCAVFYFSLTNIYVITPEIKTYYVFFVGILFFDAGCISSKIFKLRHIRFGNKKIAAFVNSYELRYFLIYCCIAICMVYYLLNFMLVLKSVSVYSLANTMSFMNTTDSLIKNSRIINFIYTIFINPFSFIAPAIAATDYWMGKKDKKVIIGTLILLLFRLASTGNRLSFLFIFIYIVLIGELLNKRLLVSIHTFIIQKRKKRIILLAITIITLLFVYTTISRGYNVVSNLTINLAIPPVLFETWANEVDSTGLYGFGEASLQGFIYPVFYILKNSVGFPMPANISAIFDIITSTITTWVDAGLYQHNAYVSIFWYFYLDYRIVGVFIFSFIFGRICFNMFNNVKRTLNCKSIAAYCIVIHALLMSYGNLTFANVSTGIGYIMILFFVYKRKHNDYKLHKEA